MEQLSVNKVERNTGLDLLRILCMFGIVWIHAGGFGKYGEFNGGPANRYVLGFCNMLAVTVDIFAFTSGWFGKVCIFLSPSMFSILLLHRSVEECKAAFMLLQDRLLQGINPFISVFISTVIFFNICLVIDLLRRLLKYLGLKLLFTKRNKQGN